MLSIAYSNGHTLKNTLEDTLQAPRVMIDGTPKGTQFEGHTTRNTLRATLSKKTVSNPRNTTELHYLRGKFLGTCSKGHPSRVMIKGHNSRDTTEGQD